MSNLKFIDDFSKDRYIKEEQTNYFSDKKLQVVIEKNAIILPVYKNQKYDTSQGSGGVLDSKGKYVETSAQLAYNMKNRVYGDYEISSNVDYIDEEVVYLNYFYKHWGHFIIDIVSRMWYLIGRENKYKVVLTTSLSQEEILNGPFLEFFILFGIKKENIIILNRPTRFKKVIIPDVSIYPGKYYTKEYKLIFENVIKHINLNKKIPSKIYLSRSDFKKASLKEKGEKEIEKYFNENGYVSIIPENMSLEEQIQHCYLCEEMVSLSGTLPHNLVFSKENKNIIILNKTYKLNKNQELINQMMNSDVTYIDVHSSLFPIAYGKGPFILKLNRNLKEFSKERKYKIKTPLFYWLTNVYKKIWYLITYFKTYHTIYSDNDIDRKKLWRYYIFK